ncbi:hypothetical protein [Amycolatopsis minnesotensis]|uniref:Endonuclease n=1 Tax=Amycolatopsis minnesotensis TaxID=337894 RepID=A0ABN2SAI5_9PSEU
MTAPAPPVAAAAIAYRLAGFRFTWADEHALQDSIADVLTTAGWPVRREVRLGPRSRIDFVVGRIGVEVKVAGTPETVTRQLQRYAHSSELDELVLATTRATHRIVPPVLAGTPVTIAYLTHLV